MFRTLHHCCLSTRFVKLSWKYAFYFTACFFLVWQDRQRNVIHILNEFVYKKMLPEWKKIILGYLRFRQVFRFFLSSGDHGGLFHWLDRIVVGLFVFVAQKASQIGPSKWYQIVYDHLCIGLKVRNSCLANSSKNWKF